MTAFRGTGRLVRVVLRRDRVRIPVWVVSILAVTGYTGWAYEDLFATEEDLAGRLELLTANPAIQVFASPGHGLDTVSLDNLGPAIVNELSSFTSVLLALMSIFLVVRHTRAEEEAGRADLVRAAPVGAYAGTTAALLVVGATNLAAGALLAAALVAIDLGVAGSVAFGLSMASVGLVCTTLALVAAQLSRFARGATAIAVGAFSVLFALRALGDIFDNGLNWLSPVGWAQATRPFAGERWWPLGLSLVLTGALGAVAATLDRRRDTGSAILPDRGGRDRASRALARPFGLAVRLQRATLFGWAAGIAATGVVIGAVSTDADDLLADLDVYQDFLDRFGDVSAADATFASFLVFLAVMVGGAAIQSALVPRREEAARRTEVLLSARVGRVRWAAAHIAVTLAGSVVLLAAAGIAAGAVHAGATGDATQLQRILAATLVHAPAVWVLASVPVALWGLAPRAAVGGWVVLAYAGVVSVYGPLFDPPQLVYDLSPFEHVPALPAEDLALAPLAGLTALALALLGAGLAGFRRRDVA